MKNSFFHKFAFVIIISFLGGNIYAQRISDPGDDPLHAKIDTANKPSTMKPVDLEQDNGPLTGNTTFRASPVSRDTTDQHKPGRIILQNRKKNL